MNLLYTDIKMKRSSGESSTTVKMAEVATVTTATKETEGADDIYKDDYPLVHSMLQFESKRHQALYQEGRAQIDYPKSNSGWIKTTFVWRGRALDLIALPWIVIVLHATIYTILQELVYDFQEHDDDRWNVFFGFVLNSTLAFLLVFRLNRAANRFWDARAFWGAVVADIRSLVGGLIVHDSSSSSSSSSGFGGHDESDVIVAAARERRPANRCHFHRDEAIRWLAALPLIIMHHLRKQLLLPADIYAGILTVDELNQVQGSNHPPLFVAEQVRYHLHQTFHITAATPASVAAMWAVHLDRLEKQLNQIIHAFGGMERIAGTPLPIVYVSHLRAFLLIDLIVFPYVFGPSWGWGCIPIVALAAFALLGIEACASEVESPFRKDRVNALNMDNYCDGALSNILQVIKNSADRSIAHKSAASAAVIVEE
jgi:ion channel-forming bestrophin family protein